MADHLAILKNGSAVWNSWREKNLSVIPDFRECNLVGIDLKRANLYRADFREAEFSSVNLNGALLREAVLSQCVFDQDCTLQGANLMKSVVTDASLDGVDLSRVSAADADFSGSDLRGANFSQAELQRARFASARLGLDVRLEGSPPDHIPLITEFIEAKLTDSDFSGCHLEGTQYAVEEVFTEKMKIPAVSFRKADLTHSNLSSAKLYAKGDTGLVLCADFRQSILFGASLRKANITGSWLWESQRSSWDIRGIVCSEASWDEHGERDERYGKGRFERAFATAHEIFLEYPDGIKPIQLALLPLLVEELSKKHKRCQVNIKSVNDLGSHARVVISVSDTKGTEDDSFEKDYVALRDELTTTQLALLEATATNRELQAVLSYQDTKVFPKLLEAAMKSGKTINIGQVAGNFVDAENAKYVETGRGASSQALSADKLAAFAQYLRTNSHEIKSKLPADQWSEVSKAVDTIEHEAASPKPDTGLIAESLTSLRKIAESASGGLIAMGIRSLLGF